MVGGWGLHSYFRVQPNYSVEVVSCCVVVGVVTICKMIRIKSELSTIITSSVTYSCPMELTQHIVKGADNYL